MSYILIWMERAYDDLADMWVAADVFTHGRIEAAIHRLNLDLRNDPWNVGESRGKLSSRMVFIGLIGAAFRIDEKSNTVRVNHVWRNGK